MTPVWLDVLVPAVILGLTELLLVRRRFARWRRAAPHRCLPCSPVWSYFATTTAVLSAALALLAVPAVATGRLGLLAVLLFALLLLLGRLLVLEVRHRRGSHQLPTHPHEADAAKRAQPGSGDSQAGPAASPPAPGP